MYHTIEFRWLCFAGLEIKGKTSLEQVVIEKGTRLRARIRPYVAESRSGPIEMADLLLEDGRVAHEVRYAAFQFLDE